MPPSGPTPSSASCFQEYLDASTFQAWDDIVPPRIKISPDGQMAHAIVQKRVHLTANDSTGKVQPERTRFAWMSVYEKQGGKWRLAAIASTDRPDSVSQPD
ncbi:MAG: nuclear transport factor 2 family protein [Gemmatimonadales bacterium]